MARGMNDPWQPHDAPGRCCTSCGAYQPYSDTREAGALRLHSYESCACRAAGAGKRLIALHKEGPAFQSPPLANCTIDNNKPLLLAERSVTTLDHIHCCDALTLLRALPEASVDLVVTSPPCNLRNTAGGGFPLGPVKGLWKHSYLAAGYDGHDDCMPHEDYVAWQRSCLTEMMRVIKNDGAIFYNHKWRVQDGILQDRADIMQGFPVRQIIIWQRAGGMNVSDRFFLPSYEVIYMIAKPDFKLVRDAIGFTDVWRIPQEANTPHPAPFPLELAERCIRATNAKIVLDPFMGSGTTGLAAKRQGRHYIGCDLSKRYVEQARERIDPPTPLFVPHLGQTPLFAPAVPLPLKDA